MTPKQKLIVFYTIVDKEIKRTLRLWIQTLLPPMITTILYFIIFGHIIGARVGDMGGVPYLVFIAPGLIIMPMIVNSFASGSASFYSAKMQHQIEELLVSPMSEFIMLLGFMTGGMFRGIIVGTVVGITTLFFVDLPIHNILLVLITALLSCAFFSLFGVFNGVFANSFDDISIVPNFILSPLIYLGGVFYSISVLPSFWQHVSLANPLFYIVDCFRDGFIQVHHIAVIPALMILTCMFLIMFCCVWYVMKKGYRLRH